MPFGARRAHGNRIPVTLPDFSTSDATVPVGDLTSCTVVSSLGDPASCRDQGFLFDVSPGYDTVSFGISTPTNPATSVFYYFTDGAFSTLGTHQTQLFGADQAGQLVVSVVPEPATWASLALGLGGVMLGTSRKGG